MKKLIDTYVSRTALIFTSAIVFVLILNLATGNQKTDFMFILGILCFIICIEIIDYSISKISFKNRFMYNTSEFLIMYPCYLLFSFFGHWFKFSITHIILFSIVFVLLFILIHLYYYAILQNESKAINSYLRKRKS